jgi:WD40 repeat protein
VVTHTVSKALRGGVQFWDVATGQPGRFFPVIGLTRGLAFSSDGGTLYVIASANLQGIDLKTGKALTLPKTTTAGAALRLAVSPNGERAAVAYTTGRVALWNLKLGTVRTWSAHTSSVGSVTFSRDSRLLVTTGDDRLIRVWSVDRLQQEAVIRGHEHGVYAAALSPDGETLVTGGGARQEGEIKVWDFPPVKDWSPLPSPARLPLHSACFVAGGRSLVTLRFDTAEVQHNDPITGKLMRTTPFPEKMDANSLATSPGRHGHVAVGGSTGRIGMVLSGATSGIVRKAHEEPVEALAFTPDGKRLASAANDGLKLWDSETGALLKTLSATAKKVELLRFSPDGHLLATGDRDGTLALWDVQKGKLLRTWKGHSEMVLALAFSPSGDRLASGGRDDLACVWDVESGEKLLTLARHAKPVRALVFSPDRKTLVSGDASGRVKVWDLATGQERASYLGMPNNVLDLAFSPDGKYLLAAGSNHVVQRWGTIPRHEARISGRPR